MIENDFVQTPKVITEMLLMNEKFEGTIEKIQKQIEFIKEYRITLISNSVTGKIMMS